MILENINFRTGSAELLQSSYAEIGKLERMLKEKTGVTAKLVGHTDSQGSEASNQTLSRNRAKAVYDVLVSNGIAASRLDFEGMGESSPVASNDTAEGRRQNRRTEFITYGDTGGTADCNEYGTRTYQKLAAAATTTTSDVPAEYTNRSYQKLSAAATTTTSDITAEYGTRTYQKIAAAASTTTTDLAAEYSNRSYQKLVSPATVEVSEVPAEYRTITKRQLVKPGGFTEWREVVCDTDITSDLVRRVQSALISRGYDVGPAGADNDMGPGTKVALVKFQKDNGLPVGQLDFETLRALGIK
jgi:hypothetical protein